MKGSADILSLSCQKSTWVSNPFLSPSPTRTRCWRYGPKLNSSNNRENYQYTYSCFLHWVWMVLLHKTLIIFFEGNEAPKNWILDQIAWSNIRNCNHSEILTNHRHEVACDEPSYPRRTKTRCRCYDPKLNWPTTGINISAYRYFLHWSSNGVASQNPNYLLLGKWSTQKQANRPDCLK